MTAISNNLYDEPPTNETFPYVLLGDMTEVNENRHTLLGFSMLANLQIYTKPGSLGYRTAKEILEKMNDVLNMKKFNMGGGFNMIICFYDNAITDRDDQYRIISVFYRIRVH